MPNSDDEHESTSGDEVIELSRLRRRIAANLVSARHTAAHVWSAVEVNYQRVEEARDQHRAEFEEREGSSLTYLPFVAIATLDALAAHPVVNSSIDLDHATQTLHGAVNLGVAVDMDQAGLIVVTVRRADQMKLRPLAREVNDLAAKARSGRLEPDDVSGSTFTITNPGPFGSYASAPIINVPNVAILSTDAVTRRPTVVTLPDGSETIGIRPIGLLGLSWDHRAFDGSTAVMFLNHVRLSLETRYWDQELV